EEVFLHVRACAGDGVHLVAANHFRERNTQFRGAHGPRERDHQLSPVIKMPDVGIGCVFQRCCVEMPVIALNELADAAHLYITNSAMRAVAFDAKITTRRSSVNCIFLKSPKARQQECATPARSVLRRAEQLSRQAQRSKLAARNPPVCGTAAP